MTRITRHRLARLVLVSAIMLNAGRMASGGAAEDGLAAFLIEREADYSDELAMLGQKYSSPGYHTTVPDGTWVHSTIGSFNYAMALLERGQPADNERAAKIIRKLLTLQDTDAASPTYGIWPWLLEEPLEKMSPPDWNWADFCGARLAQMLVDHSDRLDDDLRGQMRAALGHAARAIRKRNVGPDYTNIAIMGGGVCAAAGEILGDAEMLAYGRARSAKVLEAARQTGGFNEYNSPTYTMVALAECERTLHLVRDAAVRDAAETLRRVAWQTIAESFHPGTQQWAGPHSRAYSDLLAPATAALLARRTGVPIAPHPSTGDATRPRYQAEHPLPCPDELRSRFAALPQDPVEVRRTFSVGRTPEDATIGTTWLSAEACLGTVNRATFWTQRRSLVAYWRTDADPAVCFRFRFLHDGRDFASMGLWTDQRGPRVLCAVRGVPRQGDWHPTLDRPAEGRFTAKDLRARFQLAGNGVRGTDLGEGRFALEAGEWRAVIHTLPGRFAGAPITWQLETVDGEVRLDAVCYHGDARTFDFNPPPETVLAAGVELLRAGEPPAASRPAAVEPRPGALEATWALPETAGPTLAVRVE